MLMMGHYPDLDSALDWLKQISCAYPDLSSDISWVWNFCAHSSDIICGETSGGMAKCLLFAQAMRFEAHIILSIA